MLPTPATYRRQFGHESRFTSSKNFLLTRSRVTNLAVFLLGVFFAVSLFLNLALYYGNGNAPTYQTEPTSILNTISRGTSIQSLDHLIIVAGHAIWTGCDANDTLHEEQWVLEERQKGGGNVEAFVSHIREGYVSLMTACNNEVNDGAFIRAESLAANERSLLVFSG